MIISGVAVLASGSACQREEAVICRTSPPESSDDYQRWADAVSAADCKHLSLQSALTAREATTAYVR
jgi:hypothetical protein